MNHFPPISRHVLFMRATLVWTVPHWYSTQSLARLPGDPGHCALLIYLSINASSRKESWWWWGHGVTRDSGNEEPSIAAVICNQWQTCDESVKTQPRLKTASLRVQKHIICLSELLLYPAKFQYALLAYICSFVSNAIYITQFELNGSLCERTMQSWHTLISYIFI